MASVPTKRVEDYTFPLWVEVINEPTSRDNETRAAVLVDAIETLVAADPTIGGVTNLLWCIVAGIDFDTDEHIDGPRTVVEMTMAAKGRIG